MNQAAIRDSERKKLAERLESLTGRGVDAVAVRVAHKLETESPRTTMLHRALGAGVAAARARIATSGPEPLDVQGSLQDASYQVRGHPVGPTTYRLRVSAKTGSTRTRRCEVTLRTTTHQKEHSSRVMRYEEPAPILAASPSSGNGELSMERPK